MAELVSRDQLLRRERGQGEITFAVQLTTSRFGNFTLLIHTLLYVVATYYIPTHNALHLVINGALHIF